MSGDDSGVMELLPFSKMHGIGNDFVVVDCRARALPLDTAAIARLGDRHLGVGFDQLLTIEPARDASCAFRYGIYNRDGSEARQCGNGVRCVAAWLRRDGALGDGLTRLESPSGPVAVEVLADGRVRVDMGVPQFAPAAIPLRERDGAALYRRRLGADDVDFGAVSMGNPHAVIEVADSAAAPVAGWGPQLETHADFPDRANVGFAEVMSSREMRLRVCARGSRHDRDRPASALARQRRVCGRRRSRAPRPRRRRGRRPPAGRHAADCLGRLRTDRLDDGSGRFRLRRELSRMSDMSLKDGITAMEVASYLRRHPEFLNEFPDLAMALRLPRDQGAAASLASYQLDVLRDKNRELTRRLRELIEIAHENEQLMIRVHTLTLSLMRATSLADSLSRVVAGLTEDFHTDLVRIVLFGRSDALPVADWLILEPGGKSALPAFAEFLQRNEPLCGRLQPDKLAALFGPRAGEVHSAVLMPVNGLGMLAIGSHDMDRFHPGMGTVFLKLIAEAITASVTRYPMC